MEKTGQKMYIDSLDEQHPERVLKGIQLDYAGFTVIFDLPAERRLKIAINAWVKEGGTIEVYEHLSGSEPGRYWLVDSGHFIVDGTDPLALLEQYLRQALGGIEHGYEGSFAEMILAAFRPKAEAIRVCSAPGCDCDHPCDDYLGNQADYFPTEG